MYVCMWMKPIVSNIAFESIDKMACKDQSLTFTAPSIKDIEKKSQSELEMHLTYTGQVTHALIHTYIENIHIFVNTYINTYIHTNYI